MPLVYTSATPEQDTEAVVRVLMHAFAGTAEGVREWLAKSGWENLRVVRDGEGATPIATLLRIPMAHFYGGKPVKTVGIAAVGVAPEARGRGVAKFLMSEGLREIARDRVALSSLYPATTTLYRRVGYEQAGTNFEHQYPVDSIAVKGDNLAIRASTAADLPAIKACYEAFARTRDGALDRGEYIWNRKMTPRDGPCSGFVVEEDAPIPDACDGRRITGYVFLRQDRNPVSGRHAVLVSDIAAVTTRAARRLLAFIGEFGSMAENMTYLCGQIHPLFSLLDEPRGLTVKFKEYWMLRVTDVAAAVSERGYHPGLSAELHVDVADEVLPQNSGRWVLRVKAVGSAERGGRGDLCCDTRGLAAAFGGLLTATNLRMLGLLGGSDDAVATLQAMFPGNPVGHCDFF